MILFINYFYYYCQELLKNLLIIFINYFDNLFSRF
nr:MAG TPA: hypothetical protein [Caudoviricetes sp.]